MSFFNLWIRVVSDMSMLSRSGKVKMSLLIG